MGFLLGILIGVLAMVVSFPEDRADSYVVEDASMECKDRGGWKILKTNYSDLSRKVKYEAKCSDGILINKIIDKEYSNVLRNPKP